MDIKDLEPIAKIILGSGLFAFLIAEVVRVIRRFKIKKRVIKEIAFELIFNERIAKMIIEDFQELQKNPCGYLRRHRFFTQVIDSVISSAYFVNLNVDLFQLIAEFVQRFRNIQAEQDGFYALESDDKMRNIINLPVHERNARVLLHDLQKSKKFKELKSKHEKEWINTRKEFINERFDTKQKEVNHGSL